MKPQPMHTSIQLFSKSVKFLFIIVLIFFSQSVSKAQSIVDDSSSVTPSTALVKHLGNNSSHVLFQVAYNNPTAEKFILIIRDKEGSTVFQNSYTDKVFDRKFRIPKSTHERLTFIIRIGKTTQVVQSFELNTNSRVVDEFVVKKQG